MQLDAGAPIIPEGSLADSGAGDASLPSAVKWVEQWKLHNAFLKSVSFGDLAYDSEEIIQIDTTLVYDYASYSGTAVQYNASVT